MSDATVNIEVARQKGFTQSLSKRIENLENKVDTLLRVVEAMEVQITTLQEMIR